jgi:hypothetical protein
MSGPRDGEDTFWIVDVFGTVSSLSVLLLDVVMMSGVLDSLLMTVTEEVGRRRLSRRL